MTDSGNHNNYKRFFEKYTVLFIALFLTICTCSIYFQVRDHDFINFDDNLYVTENRHVLSGLTLDNIKWALSFSNEDKFYWHPLTWISHMTDVQLWGIDAGQHHLSNLVLHVINTLLLFLFKDLSKIYYLNILLFVFAFVWLVVSVIFKKIYQNYHLSKIEKRN